MRPITRLLVSSLAAAAFTVGVAAAAEASAATPAAAAFEKLKTLAGEWQTKDETDTPVTVNYKVVSGGSAVMEEMSHGGMVTVYHMDGDRLMMTHYCEEKNQPRMRTEPIKAAGNTLKFSLIDVTNLAKPTDGHMKALEMTFKDADHFSAQWTYSKDRKDSPYTFNYERKKS